MNRPLAALGAQDRLSRCSGPKPDSGIRMVLLLVIHPLNLIIRNEQQLGCSPRFQGQIRDSPQRPSGEGPIAPPYPPSRWFVMLRYALIFFIVAIIAAVLGFGGIAGAAAEIAKILFFIFIPIFLISLLFGLIRGG